MSVTNVFDTSHRMALHVRATASTAQQAQLRWHSAVSRSRRALGICQGHQRRFGQPRYMDSITRRFLLQQLHGMPNMGVHNMLGLQTSPGHVLLKGC